MPDDLSWTGAANKDFKNPGNWKNDTKPAGGTDPTGNDDTITVTMPTTVTSSTSIAVDSLGTSADVTLAIGGASTFTIANKTKQLTNSGVINVGDGSTLAVSGTENNAGTINLQGDKAATSLLLNASTTFSGGGKVTLSDSSKNVITTATGVSATLTNKNNTISGAGMIGGAGLTISNAAGGVINATGESELKLNAGGNTLTNAGMLMASNKAGGLRIYGNVKNAGGTIAGAGGSVLLNGATVTGGTLASSDGGGIAVVDSSTLSSLTNNAAVTVNSGETLTLRGAIANAGSITINPAAKDKTTTLTVGGTTLSGKGTVVLSDSAKNTISGGTLSNVDNTISGAGTINVSTLTNAGNVNADGKNALILKSDTTNTGTLLASGAGGLTITGTVTNGTKVKAVITKGTVSANGGDVTLAGGTIRGGILATAGTNAIVVTGSSTLDGSRDIGAVDQTGTVKVGDGQTLTIKGTINNKGMIALNADKTTTSLLVDGKATLTGGGSVVLSNSAMNLINGTKDGGQLTNNDNTISGAGKIGDGKGTLTLVNATAGVIDAQGDKYLILNTGKTVTNEGMIKSSTGSLFLEDNVANKGGTIAAAGKSLYLSRTGGLTISGGTLASNDKSSIVLFDNATIAGTDKSGTLTNNAAINLYGNVLTVDGKVHNTGTIAKDAKNGGSVTILKGALFYGIGAINAPTDNAGTIEAAAEKGGSTLTIGGALTGAGALKIDADSTLVLSAAAKATTTTFNGANAKLVVTTPKQLSTTIAGFAQTDLIDLNLDPLGAPFDATKTTLSYAGNKTAGVLTVSYNGKAITTLNFSGNYATADFTDQADADKSTEILLKPPPMECFVAGTRIATPGGATAVERLAPGAAVLTASGRTATVVWIGRRDVAPGLMPDPQMLLPIRICRDAVAPGLPSRDLLVSPDHGILLDGRLFQARLLVNGASIRQEYHPRVTYYHVELMRHDILLAEGLPAESYLDTGNRSCFAHHPQRRPPAPDFAGDTQQRARLSCAELAVDPALTEPVWRHLAARAAARGYALPQAALTTDPALRVEADAAAPRLLRTAARRYAVGLAAGTRRLRLRSRAVEPAAIRPWLDDRRRLGVAVERILLHGPDGIEELPVDHPGLSAGWHAAERQGARLWRWTDGDAVLTLPGTAGLLELHLGAEQPYPVGSSPYAPAAPGSVVGSGDRRAADRAAS